MGIRSELERNVIKHNLYEMRVKGKIAKIKPVTVTQKKLQKTKLKTLLEKSHFLPIIEGFCKVLDDLLKPEDIHESVPYKFT